jgi:hypothetical protein
MSDDRVVLKENTPLSQNRGMLKAAGAKSTMCRSHEERLFFLGNVLIQPLNILISTMIFSDIFRNQI